MNPELRLQLQRSLTIQAHNAVADAREALERAEREVCIARIRLEWAVESWRREEQRLIEVEFEAAAGSKRPLIGPVLAEVI
jgi:hypothetical protein